MSEPRPCSADEAVQRARQLLASPGNASTGYVLGTGTYRPVTMGGRLIDVPWSQTTDPTGMVHIGSDCAGLICWAYKLPRHRPGYNTGAWATVSDDLNSNSFIEDADHGHELFVRASGEPKPGDVLAYPTIHLQGHTFIGHVALVVGIARWTGAGFHELNIIQVCGPNGRTPAAIASDGHVFDAHSTIWPKPEHRSVLLRVIT